MSSEKPAVRRGSAGIVGGGIIGLSIGWRLAQSGWDVTILEQATLGSEASWAAAGMLAPGGEYEEPSPLVTFGLASRLLYRPFIQELQEAAGTSIDFQENGALELAYSVEELSELEAKASRQHDLGILSKPVPLARVKAFWPRVRHEGLHGARFYPEDAIVNPREMTAALRTACVALGAQVREEFAVASIQIGETKSEIEGQAGTLSFDTVIVAAGAWSSFIAVSGTPPLPPSKPIKGHLVAYHQPQQTCSTIVRHQNVYALQRASGLMIVGASVEDVGFDRAVESRIANEISQRAGDLFPHLAETTPSDVWTGFRPSGTLQLGSWHSRRLWLAYGHYRNGILLTPWTARKLADELNASL